MQVFVETEMETLVEALRKTGYRRDRRRAGSFRRGKLHILLTPTPSGIILGIHKDTKTIRVDKRHVRHHGKYRGKDLKKEIAKIEAAL